MTPPTPNPESSQPSRWEALGWSALVSALFLVVYGSCNWITSLRPNVGVVQFAWERMIPVIPWMIVPYMSIDLFFVGAPFLCRTRRELRTLIGRMATATIVAGACFLLFPLTLANVRPEMSGAFGMMHDALKTGDKPFNLFPSLHVAYLFILWPHYHRHARGVIRAAIHIWFPLVLVSVLFVRQHHFIDMVGGAILAVGCLYIVPDARGAIDSMRRAEIAARYLAGAVLMYILALATWRWGFIAAWIAMALVIMACAYAF